MPVERLARAVLERIEVIDGDLRELATARARAVKAALLGRGIAGERLFVAAAGPSAVTETGARRVAADLLP